MFSYCKRATFIDPKTMEYNTSVENTTAGKRNMLCQGINMGTHLNRGLPRDLIDLETAMRGQNRSLQPYCANEVEDIQFSVFDRAMPRAAFGPLPQAPISVIQTRDVTNTINAGCYHGDGNCGADCNHAPMCPCKSQWQTRNIQPQQMPPSTLCVQETTKMY